VPPAIITAARAALATDFAESSLGAELSAEVGQGQSVAVLPSEKGLIAASADGRRERRLAAGEVKDVLVDDRAGVIWFAQAGALWMLDLELPRAQPELVARDIGDGLVSIVHGTGVPERLRHKGSAYSGALELVLSASSPAFRYDCGIHDSIFEEHGARNAQRAERARWQAGMQKRLLSVAARSAGRRLFVQELAASQRVPQVEAGACQDADLCGLASPVGGTRFLYVIVGHECGDACHVLRQLYDTRTREFFDARQPKRRDNKPVRAGGHADLDATDDLWVAANGEGFISNGVLYDFEHGVLRGAKSMRGGGWIGSQWYVE
jgi:hypothetical protein